MQNVEFERLRYLDCDFDCSGSGGAPGGRLGNLHLTPGAETPRWDSIRWCDQKTIGPVARPNWRSGVLVLANENLDNGGLTGVVHSTKLNNGGHLICEWRRAER